MTEQSEPSASVRSRLAHEFRVYMTISIYLFVCFSVVMIYDASQAVGNSPAALNLSIALVKSLILGKFILIGEMMGPGTRIDAKTLLHRIVLRVVSLSAVLVVFKALEELILGLVHGQAVGEIVAELGEMTWLGLLGPLLLMILILVPLIGATELDRALGDNGLKGIMLQRK